MSKTYITATQTFYRVLLTANGARYAIEHGLLKHAQATMREAKKDPQVVKGEMLRVETRCTMHKVLAQVFPISSWEKKPCSIQKKKKSLSSSRKSSR